jgi:hypothetical protein
MTQSQPEGLDSNSQKEEFSYAYIHAVVAAAGYVFDIKKRGMDNAGIDITVEVPGEITAYLSPKFDAQVKCTSQNCIFGNEIRFELGIKNYERLIHPNPYVPQILIVVLVSQNIEDWVKIEEIGNISTILNAGAYWISLKGENKTTNKATITVKIPLKNRLSPEMVQEIMRRIARKEEL